MGSVGEVIAEITALAFLSPEVQTCAHDLESPLGESCSGVVMGKGDIEDVPEGDREPREPFLFFFFFFLMYLLIFAVQSLHCCAGFSLVLVSGLLIAVISLAVEHGL